MAVYDPYGCGNPGAQCAPHPDLDRYNARLGCLYLNGHGTPGECLPHACPPVQCGNTCPEPCPDNVPFADCSAWYAKQAHANTDCSYFHAAMILRMVAEVPMSGCKGPCRSVAQDGTVAWTTPADGSPGCCTFATNPNAGFSGTALDGTPITLPPLATSSPGVDYDPTRSTAQTGLVTVNALRLPGAAQVPDTTQTAPYPPQAAADGVTAYQKLLNFWLSCEHMTCSCPSKAATDTNKSMICSGHGACEATPTTSGGHTYACFCDEGYTGTDCSVPGAAELCATSWSNDLSAPVQCGGSSKGTCTPTGTNAQGKPTYECVCNPGWTGTSCAQRVCPAIGGAVCSGNGSCISAEGLCVCDAGFTGAACNCSVDPATGNQSCTSSVPGNNTDTATSDAQVTGTASDTDTVTDSLTKELLIGAGCVVVLIILLVGGVWALEGAHKTRRKAKAGTEAGLAEALAKNRHLRAAKQAAVTNRAV